MKPKVYLETTVISYLASRASRDLVVAANQQITAEWWQQRRVDFELYVSHLVVREARMGDPSAANQRVHFLEGLPLLGITLSVSELAAALIAQDAVPAVFAEDALHIALATVHGMEYLLTWNFKHIANAIMRARIESVCRQKGYEPPVICSPQELLEV